MKIYDEITNEELTSPDLSAGYLYTARRVAEHVPESREVMQGTVTEDDPKGLEHIISGYDVYEDCQLYHRLHRWPNWPSGSKRTMRGEQHGRRTHATKLSLDVGRDPHRRRMPTMAPKLGYKSVLHLQRHGGIYAGQTAGRPNARDGTVTTARCTGVDGMTVCTGYYYTDGGQTVSWPCRTARPRRWTDTEWFEVV